MFNKLANVIQHAVEALAPDTPLLEDFVYHWKCVTNFYIETTDDKTPVTDTNIPSHLKQMIGILLNEEQQTEAVDTGPCMEYLLQHKILETLYTLGKADIPPGMKQQVLIFFKHILGRIQQPLLPHISVHRPVAKLVQVCGEVRAGPNEADEVSFLCTVCARLKRAPHLINIFHSEQTDSQDSSTSETSVENKVEKKRNDLVNSLLNLSRSEDSRVAVKACEGLLLLVSMPYEAAKATVEETQLCLLLNTRLVSLFTSMPASIDPNDVEMLMVKWGLDSHGYAYGDIGNFAGKRSVVSFLSWFDYCDTLIMEAHESCGNHIAKSIACNFLQTTLMGLMMQADEKAALTTTAIFTKLLTMVRSKQLLNEMIDFVIPPVHQEDSTSQLNEDEDKSGSMNRKLTARLFQRCDHISDEISVITLRMFETLISKSSPKPLQRLVLDYLTDRGYHAKNPGNLVVQTEAGDLEWDLEPGLDHGASSPVQSDQHSDSTTNDAARESPKLQIQQTVHSFLTVLPDSAKSSQVQDDDSGYDSYLREAHRSYKEICSLCKDYKWPELINFKSGSAERSKAVADYDEGPFLKMLFGKISRILSQPYAVNLVVTSIASRLALLPHPLTHELFTDPLLQLRPKAHSLFSVVQVLAEQVIHRIVRVNNFKNKLLAARRKLTGANNDDDTTTRSKSICLSSVFDNFICFINRYSY